MQILKVVVTDFWFDQIEAGLKKHEYRKFSKYWIKRLTLDFSVELAPSFNSSFVTFGNVVYRFRFKHFDLIEFQRAYRKNPKRMTFGIKNLGSLNSGIDSDLRCIEPVFDIYLGERVK